MNGAAVYISNEQVPKNKAVCRVSNALNAFEKSE